MTLRNQIAQFRVLCVIAVLSFPLASRSQNVDDLKKEVDELKVQNLQLQQRLQQQQEMIEELSRKFSGLQKTNESQANDVRQLKSNAENPAAPPEKSKGFSINNVVISGEGAAGVFETGKNGMFPNAALRVDELRLFVDAPIWQDVYFYGEVDLLTREAFDSRVYPGEIYLQWENLAKHWNLDQLLNLRVGQFYTPFGEEYERRFAIDNPLISHSLSDLWGISPGLELYGNWKHLNYAAAIQDGGSSTLTDATADKSIAARIGYEPAPWLNFSVSGMRTGKLSVSQDVVSATWFGAGFFTSIGSPATTLFEANLAEFDVQGKWKAGNGGYVRAAGGYAGYDDNDPAGDNHRDIYYYYIEALQHVARKLYGAARWSQISAPGGGYSIVGNTPTFGLPTSELWRLSLGMGYEFNDHLVLKLEYMFEQGRLSTGGVRNHEDMFSAEAAFKF